MATARVVHTSLWDLFDAIVGVNTYDGEIVGPDGRPTSPPLDADGRVHAYAVLYDSPGRRYANALNGAQVSVDKTFQVTCVGGDPTRVMSCVDKVVAQLVGAAVTVDGVVRRIRLREDDPGNVRPDNNVTPVRHYVPLRFQLFMP